MSPGARITIGVATAISAVLFVLTGIAFGKELPNGPWPLYGLGAFCGIVALACLVPRSRPVTLRIIGAAIFVIFAHYAYDSYGKDNFNRALVGFLVLGLPAGFVAITGGYPTWGRAAGAFTSAELEEDRTGEQARGSFPTLGSFDLARLNANGWLLFIASALFFIAGCFVVFQFDKVLGGPDSALTKLLLFGVVVAAVGFFWLMRCLLKWFGGSIYHRE